MPTEAAQDPAAQETSAFEAALQRYHQGAQAAELVDEFAAIAAQNPRQSAGRPKSHSTSVL